MFVLMLSESAVLSSLSLIGPAPDGFASESKKNAILRCANCG